MPITVSDIEQKEFHFKLFKGYDPEEVDRYLDDICDQMYLLYQHIDTLQQRLAQANTAPAYVRSAVPPPAANVNYAAQAQDELAQARQKARGIIEEAQQDAKDIREEAMALREEAQRMMDEAVAMEGQAHIMAQDTAEYPGGLVSQSQESYDDLLQEKEALKEEIEMLRATARDYRQRFLRLVEDQQHVLHAETELFD